MVESPIGRNIGFGATEFPSYDGYEVVKRLGIGAASVIFSVRDKKSGEIRALKHVVRQENEDKRMIHQVENEHRIGGKLDHPYIRNIYEIKKRRIRLRTHEVFLLMEYCPGISLEQSPLRSLIDLMLIFRMIAEGINGMHQKGFLHCDIKTNNIIIAENGAIRIIDLGQSCRIGTVKPRIQGTPDYIAPEQVKRKPLSRATDVFNLGATMYWALAGRHIPTLVPKKTDRVELADASNTGPPPSPHELRPKIPTGVSNLVMDCVRHHSKDRPGDMNTLISRLDLLIHMIAGGEPLVNVSGNDD